MAPITGSIKITRIQHTLSCVGGSCLRQSMSIQKWNMRQMVAMMQNPGSETQ